MRRAALATVLSLAMGIGSTASAASSCIGDCDGDSVVRINELIMAVSIVMGAAPLSACPSIDCEASLGAPSVSCAVAAVAKCSPPIIRARPISRAKPPGCTQLVRRPPVAL